MKFRALLLAVMSSSLLFGCANQQRSVMTLGNRFKAEDVAWAKAKGTGKIVGSAVIQTNGGIPRNCAGRGVGLIPVSPYSSERFGRAYGNENKGFVRTFPIFETNQEYTETARATTCDAQGSFEFDELPAGEYFISTTVMWQASQYATEGGYLMLRVKVEDGKTKKFVLAP